MKAFKEIDISLPETPEDPFHTSDSNDSLYCPSVDKEKSSDSSDTGHKFTISPYSPKNKSDTLNTARSIDPQKNCQNKYIWFNSNFLLCNKDFKDNKKHRLSSAGSTDSQKDQNVLSN